MGCSSSKLEKCEALRLCKERKRFVKEAIDSRYTFTAAHLSYIESLKSIGIALRRYAEAEVLIGETPLLPNEESPSHSHSSYPSPSPSHNAELGECSPLPNQSPYSPISPLPHESGINYMKSNGSGAITVKFEPVMSRFGEDDSFDFPLPPPPPPEIGSSWDFFDTSRDSDETKWSKLVREKGGNEECSVDDIGENYVESKVGFELRGAKISDISAARRDAMMSNNLDSLEKFEDAEQTALVDEHINSASAVALTGEAVLGQSRSKMESAGAEREDPSEFITHRAKDFLSSIKDIEHRFFRASESGKEVSRMLEANKIKLRCSEAKGRSSAAMFLAAFHQACCRGDTVIPHEPPQPVMKAIMWHRSVSSRSSSSKNPLATAPRDDVSDSGSDFVDEFCMITGSHSSTLDRLYAWELKLYDEVKASEFIRKSYDYWCAQLRHQFAKDASTHVIDKTRAIIKDLHSQMRVALHAVDSIAKRIEKLRDEELLPQLIELIQGLIRMWKVMLECHHAQYITISLAYHTKTSSTTDKDSQNQVISHLQHEIECFESSFRDWIEAHRSYIESLNGWLQICIILPQEKFRGRRAFSPRRALAPPIFVLCRDWSTGIKTLPSSELIDAINAFISDLNSSKEPGHSGEEEEGETRENDDLSNIHTSLTKVLDRLTKFAEALRKMYEDVRQGTETAQVAFANYKTGAARHFGNNHL